MEKDVFEAIGNPVRRKILLLLNRKAMGYKELATELQISIGSLYYHLNYLKPYIVQDREKRFMLSEEGQMLVRDIIAGRIGEHPSTTSIRIMNILTLQPIVGVTGFNLFFSLVLGGLLFLIEYSILNTLDASVFLTMPYINIENKFFAALLYLVSLGIISVVAIVITLVYGKKTNIVRLILHAPLVLLPIALYTYISISAPLPHGAKEILYYPFTLWFLGLFARVLKDISGVNYVYSLIIGLIISYVSFAVILL